MTEMTNEERAQKLIDFIWPNITAEGVNYGAIKAEVATHLNAVHEQAVADYRRQRDETLESVRAEAARAERERVLRALTKDCPKCGGEGRYHKPRN